LLIQNEIQPNFVRIKTIGEILVFSLRAYDKLESGGKFLLAAGRATKQYRDPKNNELPSFWKYIEHEKLLLEKFWHENSRTAAK
jgi:hypothetical protein